MIEIFKPMILVLTMALAACSSMPQSKALSQVRVGMDKAEVLEIAGNPTRKGREHGQDRWTYEDPNSPSSPANHVYFADGKVTYVGVKKDPEAKSKPAKASSFQKISE